MRTLMCTAAILAVIFHTISAEDLQLGAPVSNFVTRDVNHGFLDYSALDGGVTVVMLFSTRCPMSNAFNFRRNALYKDFVGRVKFIVVDPNDNESTEEVREYARSVEFDFPVYQDVKNSVTNRFRAQVTTETFLIDSSHILRYRGYIEDSPNPTRATNQALRRAIEAVLAGEPVTVRETKAPGCAIRRSPQP